MRFGSFGSRLGRGLAGGSSPCGRQFASGTSRATYNLPLAKTFASPHTPRALFAHTISVSDAPSLSCSTPLGRPLSTDVNDETAESVQQPPPPPIGRSFPLNQANKWGGGHDLRINSGGWRWSIRSWDTVKACLLLSRALFSVQLLQLFQQAARIKAGDKNALSGIGTSVLQLEVCCCDH